MEKIAVIGSGVMGSGIAAHIANAGVKVLLFDIVLPNKQRNFLTENAIQKLKQNKIFASLKAAQLITPLNLEDNLSELKDCNWIIEAITEQLELKHDLYRKINFYKNDSCLISSNTSTIKLENLLRNMPVDFQEKFFITHFFNPPRYMRLLEIVLHPANKQNDINLLSQFCHDKLGKEIVFCYDSPGFIANRLGCYWLEMSMREAARLNLLPHEVDQALAKYLHTPKTGVFGLYDLIGLDLMKLIAESFQVSLPITDEYVNVVKEYPNFYSKLLANNYIGRKGKGGFYYFNNNQKQELNLQTGEYQNLTYPNLPNSEDIKELFSRTDSISEFISITVLKLLHYTLIHSFSISQDINSIDTAMKTGYNWHFGPFEIIDQIGKVFLKNQFLKYNFSIPPLLVENELPFYQNKSFLDYKGAYITSPLNKLSLSDYKDNAHPTYAFENCNLWDVGDKVFCLEFSSKMNSLTVDIFESIIKIVDYINNTNSKLIIGGNNSLFSSGADLKYIAKNIEQKSFKDIENFILLGQKALNYIQNSESKIISLVSGYALGGGCELLLHTHQVVAYIESYIGLVEPTIGLIPGWGGCNQLIKKNHPHSYERILYNIFRGTISNSAFEAQEMGILSDTDVIVMNIDNLFAKAKILALEPKSKQTRNSNILPRMEISDINNPIHDNDVLKKLKQIFYTMDTQNINYFEKEYFMELIRKLETQSMIIKKIQSK